MKRRHLLLLLALAAIIRFAYLADYLASLPYGDAPIADAYVHDAFANRMLRGHLVDEEYTVRSPLFPVLLAGLKGIGLSFGAIYIFQMLLGLATVVLVYRISAHLFGDQAPLAPLIGASLFALYGSAAFHETKLLGVSVGVFFLVVAGSLILWARARRSVAEIPAGVALSLASLAVPQFALSAILVAVLQLARKRFGRALLFGLGFVVPLVPFSVRSHLAGAGLNPFPAQSGGMLYVGFHDGANGAFRPPVELDGPVVSITQKGRRAAEEETGRPLGTHEASNHFRAKAIRWIVDHPLGALRLIAIKVYRLAMAYEVPLNYDFQEERPDTPTLYAYPVPFSLLFVFGVAGFVMATRRRISQGILVALAVPTILTVLAFVVTARYRLPLAPFLAIWAGFALHVVLVENRKKLAVILGAASALLLVNPLDDPRFPAAAEQLNRASAYRGTNPERALAALDRAIAFTPEVPSLWATRTEFALSAGNLAEARRGLRETTRLAPDSATAALLRGEVMLLEDRARQSEAQAVWRAALAEAPGRKARNRRLLLALGASLRDEGNAGQTEAATLFRELLARDPRDATAHAELGLVQIAAGDFVAAEASFRHAAKNDPDSAGHWNNLGVALLRQQRHREACTAFREALAIDPAFARARQNLARCESIPTWIPG